MYTIVQHMQFGVIVHISEDPVDQMEEFICVEEKQICWYDIRKYQCFIYELRDQMWKKHIYTRFQ